MHLPRRAFLRTSGAALLTLSTPAFALEKVMPAAGAARSGVRSLKFENIHTGEKLAADYFLNGAYQPQAMQAINHVLRDYRTGDVHTMDPKLMDLLFDMHGQLETDAAFQVISGYRSSQTNGMLHERSSGVASKSLHMQGMAIDIRVPGRSLVNVHQTALKMGRGGVGMYPTSNFVHVDVGRVRQWSGT
ncbi:MAG: DUF882 domain-containing protein [Alphaproteobacteria bacterium]|nr:DUF882 domain-containing protein [Alphaproteobacteria bacterium]